MHIDTKLKVSNIMQEYLKNEIKFQQQLTSDLKYAIDNNLGTEQIEYIENYLLEYSRTLFVLYEVKEKQLYKDFKLDYSESFCYNYIEGIKRQWKL